VVPLDDESRVSVHCFARTPKKATDIISDTAAQLVKWTPDLGPVD
jgi:hypothetical protein